MTKIIDGKAISMQIKEEIKKEAASLKEQGKNVTLAVIQVGDNPASCVYVRNKKKGCEYIGIGSLSYELKEETTQEELLSLIRELNAREDVNGILVQLPLPAHIDEDTVIREIDPKKDVDGFHPQSVGALCIGQPGFVSCTPAGIIELLKRSGVSLEGKECVILGRSNIVGKPMARLLLAENGTVTVCHSRTSNMDEILQEAEIFVAAVGRPKFFHGSQFREGTVIIDVGIHRDENGICGDVDFESCQGIASYITPVPGGVGPMTIAMLLYNTLRAYEHQHGLSGGEKRA